MGGDGLEPPLDAAFLASVPIFGGLTGSPLDTVASHLVRVLLPAGSPVVAEGDGAREMYVVESGELEVRKDDEVVLARLRRGDCVGEMSLLDIQPRSATVRALTDTSLLVLRYRELMAIRRQDPEAFTLLVLNIAREVSRRLRVCQGLLLDAVHAGHVEGPAMHEVFGSTRG